MTQLERRGMACTLFVVYESHTISLPSYEMDRLLKNKCLEKRNEIENNSSYENVRNTNERHKL